MKHRQLLKKYNYDETNNFQQDAINHGLLGGEKFVICTPTASGKTFMAILAIDECINNGDKAVYVSPIRAISKQVKHELSKLGRVGQIIGGKQIDHIRYLFKYYISVFPHVLWNLSLFLTVSLLMSS